LTILYVLYYALLCALIVFFGALGYYSYRHRSLKGAVSLTALLLLFCFTTVCYVFSQAIESETVAFLWVRARFFGLGFSTSVSILFTLQYIGISKKWLRYSPLLFVIPVITNIIVWTQPLSSSNFFAGWERTANSIIFIETVTYKDWFWVHLIYSFICTNLALLLLYIYLLRTVGNKRWYVEGFLGTGLGGVLLVLFTTRLSSLGFPNSTPFALALVGGCFFWLFYRQQALAVPSISYNSVIHYMQDAVFVTNANNRIVSMNPAAENITGTVEFEAMGKPITDVLAELTFISLENVYNGNPFEITRNNVVYDVQITDLKGAKDKNKGIIYILRDVTRQKKLDLELGLREQAIQVSPVGITIADARQTDIPLVYANQAFLDTTGYQLNEVIGQNCRFLQSSDNAQPELEILREAIRQGKFCKVLLRNYRKDGTLFWNDLSMMPVFNDKAELTHFVGIQMDITDRIVFEQTLQESEERYRSMIKALGVGVVLQDSSGRIQEANESASQILGLSFEQMAGRSSIDPRWQAIHEEGTPFPGETHPSMMALETGQPQRNVTMGVHKPNGELTWLKVNSQPLIRPGDSKPYGVVTSFSDITALREAVEGAQAASLAKSRFVSSMSHELRTPLNSILGFAELVAAEPCANPEHEEFNNIIIKSGEHLLTLINDVLEISKIEAGKLTLVPKRFNIYETLELVEQMFRQQAQNKGLEFRLNIAEHLPEWIIGDEVRLRQIILNLVSNAFKFTERGCIKLDVNFGRTNRLIISVIDTGVGVSEDEQKTLFQPFNQTQSGIALGQGTGLGLYLCQQFARLMGGKISVTSLPNVGSTFILEVEVEVANLELIQNSPKIPVTNGQDTPSDIMHLFKNLPASSQQDFKLAMAEANLGKVRSLAMSFSSDQAILKTELDKLVDDYKIDVLFELAEKL
jgi:PAS domain S-box-containing protein